MPASPSPTQDPWCLRVITLGRIVQAGTELEDFDAVRCFGNRDLQLVGYLAPPDGVGGTYVGLEPAWLATNVPLLPMLWLDEQSLCAPSYVNEVTCSGMFVYAPDPARLPLAPRRWVRVTGHFDDPAALTCHWDGVHGTYVADADLVAMCRERFVVTAIETITPSPGSGTLDLAATGGILPPDSIATILVDKLNVRNKPALHGQLVGSVATGTKVLVLDDGPVRADGFDWYSIVGGWAAAGTAKTPYLQTVEPRCELANEIRLTPFERLWCSGNRSLTLEGTYGCRGCGGYNPGTWEPRWLIDPIQWGFHVLRNASGGPGIDWLDLHFPPELNLATPPDGSILRVVGHFDDPAAQSCRIAVGEEGAQTPVEARTAVMRCREKFVVESYQIIGTDPSWRGG